MSITYHERPGVYADYDASSVYSTGNGTKTVAMIGASTATAGVYTVTSVSGIDSVFGAQTQLAKMLKLAFLGGAAKVLAYPLAADSLEAYTPAIQAIFACKEASLCVIGSALQEVQTALKTAVESASGNKNECIALVGMEQATVAQYTTRAAALDSHRMVLVAPQVYLGSTLYGGCMAAAALAGILSYQTDPSLPLNGTVLPELSGVDATWTESELDELIAGGVTPFEFVGGTVRVIRAVTTRADNPTWRELNTTLIIDDVIPAIRSALQTRFARAKNNAITRNAIRNQVIVELESRVQAQVIDSYESLTIAANASDPTACDVSFNFTVTHGLNRILLTAHISV